MVSAKEARSIVLDFLGQKIAEAAQEGKSCYHYQGKLNDEYCELLEKYGYICQHVDPKQSAPNTAVAQYTLIK